MNNIYKVIWSKAKNCYVVASEIARSHTKSASGSEKIGGGTRRKLLASLMALSLLCGGLGVANAEDSIVHVEDIAATATSKEVYTRSKVDDLLDAKANKGDVETNKTAINDLKGDVESNKTAINDLKTADTALNTRIDGEVLERSASDQALDAKIEAEKQERSVSDQALDAKIEAEKQERSVSDQALDAKIEAEKQERSASDQALNARITTAINGLKAKDTELEGKIQDNADAIAATDKRTGGISRNNAGSETTIEGHVTVDNLGNVKAKGNVTADGKLKGEGVDAGAGDITTTGAVNAGSLKVENASNLKGDVTMDKRLSVTGDTSLKKTDVDGALNAKGDVILGTNTQNTVTVNGNADFNEAVNMDKGLTVTNGATKLKETTVEGKLTAGDAELKNTTVGGTLGVTGETKLNDKLTVTGEATFKDKVTAEKDLTVGGKLNVGEIYLEHKKLESTGKEYDSATSITADGISNRAKVTDEHGKSTESKFTHNEKGTFSYATDKDGNTTYTKVTATENSFQVQDKDAKNKNHQVNTKDSSVTEITNEEGKTTKTEQTAKDITNTAKDGTITNDAQTIVNNATGDMTNTVGGKQTNKIDGNQENTIGGNQTTNVTGDISNMAKNITNEATEKLTDKVGDNTRVTTSTSITDTVGTANRKIENDKITDTAGDSTVTTENGKGTTFAKNGSTAYSTDAGAPTDTNIAGNHITTGRVDANELGVSDKDGANTADLSVKAGEGVKASAGNGTTTGSLDVTAEEVGSSVTDASGKGSTFKQRIDAIMGNVKTDAGESEVTQKGDEITSVVGKGEATNSRVTQKKGSLEAAVTDGTNTNVSYDVANASAKVLTDGTKENKLQDNLDSSEKTITNGTYKTSKVQTALDITNTAKDGTITNDAKNIVNNASGDMTNTVGGKLTTTVTGATEENYNGGLTTNVTGEENHTVTGKQNNKVTGKQTNTVEGGQENIISGGQINTITGGQINNITGDQTTNVTGDISNTANNITNEAKTELTDKVGTNTRVINSRSITDTVGTKTNRKIEDGKITDTAGDITVTTDEDNGTTFANAGSTASSFTTVDGTNTGLAKRVTNVKGNEISTGKVEANYVKMDYADVMHDLGVHGSAKVDNDLTVGGITTTKTLKVTEDAEVGRDLAVGGNANITGDVTANSYKVGRNTYIDANGINANNQKITNVADGSISEGSKDAVNGGQLYGVKRDLEHQVDKVGANAAAMANLRPMEFDPSSKWNIAAAIGNYGSETAAALGAFYRPNDNVMVNLSTAFGTGENMVGGGVSVRLGKGGNKLSREETNALKAQVADLTARMDALLSVLNPNMSKDFPDVPENHWAYEAVSRLAGNDIVQGYPDGEFHGERTMTRYEMAEIIYNALSRGAEAERELVEEFKPELQAMAASEKATAEKAEG